MVPLPVVESGGTVSSAATCVATAGCDFTVAFAVAQTPQLLSASPTFGQEGDVLTVRGFGLSPAPPNNSVTVGGRTCTPIAAEVDESYRAPDCPAPPGVLGSLSGLIAALGDSSMRRIVLEPGTYALDAELSISRRITAASATAAAAAAAAANLTATAAAAAAAAAATVTTTAATAIARLVTDAATAAAATAAAAVAAAATRLGAMARPSDYTRLPGKQSEYE